MGERLSIALLVKEAAIAPLLVGAAPAWLWHRDATHLLWSNAAGAACFGAAALSDVLALRFAADDLRATQIRRIAGTLYPGGVPRLERLRGFAPGIGAVLVCSCARATVAGKTATLVAAKTTAGKPPPLAARLRFLFAGCDDGIAAFTPEGVLLAATPLAARRLGTTQTLGAIGADGIALAALAEGRAGGDTRLGAIALTRVGQGEETVLFAMLAAAADPAATAAVSSPHQVPAVVAPAVVAPSPTVSPSLPAAAPEVRPVPPPPAEPPPLRIDLAPPEEGTPLRFVWQMDPDGRFMLGSDAFVAAIGSRTAALLGRPWQDIATELALDPDNAVLRAVETRTTWSGITVSFPVNGSTDRLKVELSGLPVYDRERNFLGYRGFGVCRDPERPMHQQPPPAVAVAAPQPAFASRIDPLAFLPAAAANKSSDSTGTLPFAADRQPPNVVRFPPAAGEPLREADPPARATRLSLGERNAFQEIARRLQAGLNAAPADLAEAPVQPARTALSGTPDAPPAAADVALPPINAFDNVAAADPPPPAEATGQAALAAFLDAWPTGLMVYRFDQPLYANRVFLDATGFATLDALIDAGGLDALSVGAAELSDDPGPLGEPLTLLPPHGNQGPLAARLFAVPWLGEPALALMLGTSSAPAAGNRPAELALRQAEAHIAELRGMIDTAFDGLIIVGRDGRLVSVNKSAEALFGVESAEVTGRPFGELFVPESRGAALDTLDRLWHSGTPVVALTNASQEVAGRTRQGQTLPLAMIVGVMPDGGNTAFAVFRDLTAAKKAEMEFSALKREVERAQTGYTELMDKFSNSVRDTLQSISGFADMMLEERLGPLSRERYRGCLRDVRAASERISELVSDVNRLRRAENGTLALSFEPVDLNMMVQRCVKKLQADASRDRIILRSALATELQSVKADVSSLQQVIEMLLANAIKHAGTGGQVIVSTAETERGQVVLRVREARIAAARRIDSLFPPPSGQGSGNGGTRPGADAGLDLVLTKTLTEANHGTLNVTARKNEGTLFELSLPVARIPAE